jgi:hypothetical protein
MGDVDDVRNAASVLIRECLQRLALQKASRGLRLWGTPASAEVKVGVDPALLERARCVVRGDGTVTVEILDPVRESWAEVYRSDAPEVIPVDAPASSAEAPAPEATPPQPGQIVWSVEQGFHVWQGK